MEEITAETLTNAHIQAVRSAIEALEQPTGYHQTVLEHCALAEDPGNRLRTCRAHVAIVFNVVGWDWEQWNGMLPDMTSEQILEVTCGRYLPHVKLVATSSGSAWFRLVRDGEALFIEAMTAKDMERISNYIVTQAPDRLAFWAAWSLRRMVPPEISMLLTDDEDSTLIREVIDRTLEAFPDLVSDATRPRCLKLAPQQ